MDLTALHHFYWVVREGNFTRAASTLCTAQPGLSRAVKRLEEQLGGRLLIRHKRRVELTPFGNSVFLQCQVMFSAAECIKALKEGEAKTKVSGALRIASSDIIAEYLLPASLNKLVERHPKLYPSVQVGTSDFLISRIAARELEFGIFFHVPSEFSPDIEIRKLGKVDFKLVVGSKFWKNRATLANFIGSREIDSPNTKSYPTLEKFRKIHPQTSIKYSSNHLALHKKMVLLGAGIAVLPVFAIRQELKQGKLRDLLPKEALTFDLKVAQHRHRPLGPAALELLTMLSQMTFSEFD